MRSRTKRFITGIGAALLLCLAQAPASAGTWEAPVGGEHILGFGQLYGTRTHRGIDLAAPAGAEIAAPDGGMVLFAGSVPADGGGTCIAVTIELADGLRVSLLPLDAAAVTAGDSVSRGAIVGWLAERGDDSSGESHLHLGLRSGSAYIDPSAFLPAVIATNSDSATESAAAAPVPVAPPTPAAPPVPTAPPAPAAPPVSAFASGAGTVAVATPSVPAVSARSTASPFASAAQAPASVPSGVAPLYASATPSGMSLASAAAGHDALEMATARPGATFGRTAAGGPVVVGGGSLTASMLDPLAGHARRRPAAAVAWAPVGNPIATLFLLALGTVSAALLVPRWATERAN